MKKYRTKEQFDSIVDSVINGNWSQAYEQAEEAGFYAEDLIRAHEQCEFGGFSDVTDIARIAEGAQKLRA